MRKYTVPICFADTRRAAQTGPQTAMALMQLPEYTPTRTLALNQWRSRRNSDGEISRRANGADVFATSS
jgi:hypothetical protein